MKQVCMIHSNPAASLWGAMAEHVVNSAAAPTPLAESCQSRRPDPAQGCCTCSVLHELKTWRVIGPLPLVIVVTVRRGDD
jgi:hypothetical protein